MAVVYIQWEYIFFLSPSLFAPVANALVKWKIHHGPPSESHVADVRLSM